MIRASCLITSRLEMRKGSLCHGTWVLRCGNRSLGQLYGAAPSNRAAGPAYPRRWRAVACCTGACRTVGCGNFWGNYAEKPASTGRPQKPYVEIAILGEDDRHLAAGERGEIAIKSAANLKAYWRDPEATAAVFTADFYVRTGDIGYLDEDDYLFIVDRKKDIIIRGGENIATQEVEAAIYSHLSVSEVAVFSVPDDRLGEVPAAAVYSEEDGTLGKDVLVPFLEERIAAYKIPAYFWFHDEPLPKLGTGKIDRVTLRDRYRAELAARA